MIKAIFFDFAGVIGTEGYWIWLRENVPNIEERKDFFDNLSDKVDKAVISHDEFLKEFASAVGITPKDVWPALSSKIIINKKLLVFIRKLKLKYKIGLFSNYTHEWLEELIDHHKLSQYFDSMYISSRYRMIKPEEGAFRKALELLDVKPREAIFIDDRKINIDAAIKLGIIGIVYTGIEQLKKDLKIIWKQA